MTAEFWSLLLSIRPLAGELPVLSALLFAFLTLLDLNCANPSDQQRVAENFAKELLETQEWVAGLFERVGEGEEEERVKMLAAGVLGRCREVVERWERVMVGELAGFVSA